MIEDRGESDLTLVGGSAEATSVMSSSAETGVGGCSSLKRAGSSLKRAGASGIERSSWIASLVSSDGVSTGVGGSSLSMSCTTTALASSTANVPSSLN